MKLHRINKPLWAIAIFLGFIVVACGSAGETVADSARYQQMLEKVSDLEFEIENTWANPTQYSRVDLLGNPNRIKFENDSVEVYLPFFGERYAGGGYSGDGAIQYEGIPKNLKIEENPEKGNVKLFFEGNRNTESFDFIITIFPNGVARTTVISTQRETIIYDGRIINRRE